MYYKVARLPIGYAPPPERDSVVTVPDRNRRLLATAIAAFDSLESDAKDSDIRQTMAWLLGENAT